MVPLTPLPRRSPLAVLVAAQRSRTPVRFFEPRATLAATLAAAAEHLAAACYAVDAYRRHSGEPIDVPDGVREAITQLSRLSWRLLGSPAGTATSASTALSIPRESNGADQRARHG